MLRLFHFSYRDVFMIKRSSALLSLLCLAAPSLATYDPFTPDTTIVSGDLGIPCESYSKTTSYHGESGSCRFFLDEDGRLIAYEDSVNLLSNGNVVGGESTSFSVIANENGRIDKEMHRSKSGGHSFSSSFSSVLEGREWNSKGCITEGIYKSSRSTSGGGPKPSVKKEVQLVAITYDEYGITPLKREILDSTFFIADTVITAGAYDISVEVYKHSGFNGKIGLSVSRICYTDSIDRIISSHANDEYYGSGDTWESDVKVEIDDRSRFLTRNYYRKTIQPDTSEFRLKQMGLVWNEKGMIASGLVYRKGVISNQGGSHETYDDTVLVQYTYDENGIDVVDSTITPQGAFKADTVILAGAVPIGCKTETVNTMDSDGKSVTYADFRDSLGRIIHRQDDIEDTVLSKSKRDLFSLFLDSENRVTQINSLWDSIGCVRMDTLIAESWNENGMILDGTLHRAVYSDGIPDSDTSLITLVYDSTGIIVTDTLSRSPVAVMKTGVISKEMALSQTGRSLVLQNFTAGEAVRLFSAKGRLIQTVRTNSLGGAQMDLSSFPAGVYFLKGMKKTHKILCR